MDSWRQLDKVGWAGVLGLMGLLASAVAQEPIAPDAEGEWAGDVNPAGRISGRFESDGEWIPVPMGSGYTVYAIVQEGRRIYAGGDFTTIGTQTVNHVAVWDGSSWSPLGSGFGNSVRALLLQGGRLYAGGDFTNAGGRAANRIAMWDGSEWTNLGTGMDQRVNSLAHDGTNLYAGGYFTNSGSLAVTRVAKWNGSAWTNLGVGVNSPPWSSLWSGGRLFVGGSFTMAGGAPTTNLAMWSGGAWTNLGGGPVGTPYALMADSRRVYAGGIKTWGMLSYSNFLSSWTYGTGVFPDFGPKQGGFRVTIRGSSLGNGSDVTNVTLCGVKATQILSQSATQVVVTAGTASTASTGAVKVYSSHLGVTTSSNAFSYLGVSSFKLQAAALTDKVVLRWPNPKQYGYESAVVQIRAATNRYPAATNEGSLVYSGTNRMVFHSPVVSRQTNFYTIWTSPNGVTFVEPN